ncbi:Enoyl-CoA hydratase/isomerase OS=Tsukamurella paurometabola (strain ATCC 8368 / DSM / CCUG 35730/ CIP 100753 / JCM 10117 / KCTC 9821 / NBRC 16120 / NCIMB 702349 / NCTC 13040) OX=521096 GN=Tpau_2831 PE=3 SV=1 [Tsukamurella paurometabola]|uniref:Enoyl-CoA hydratase/isomerase n=1 Tax=Tsukamurella paurometabola (strain ATCC 8368 / DSM 20162 / CCUG 35730 / CIP 100753 / JCM 10117 / KCTC 9821 / NBRC 16120 / NCIMB 702349 / NCTC 13040) TaxID=521096 RepID=D5UTE4_TSUPD|nr:enoyl-CoA hydratase family protein [Tsukamurella paurometabola]ADG79429.1 Enoyl-CoA hydratase/isomerase [Tsukamurella paurometabola DSM 20162]SUP35692.1 1,4-Dihydroxy-2-naphthoyl-CoA synthase [Tsukamurella paurometabola]
MTDAPLVRYEVRDGAAYLTIDSPHNRNAISQRLLTDLRAGIDRAGIDDTVRAVVLTHDGGTFCAGADLKEAAASGAGSDPKSRTLAMIDAMRGVIESPKPVIAQVNGHVRAGGFGLIGSCDFVFAGPESTFAVTETRIGVAPAMVSLVLLPHLPSRVASSLLLTGRKFDAIEAASHGLITAAVDDPEAAVADQLAELRLCSPQGLRETKQILWHDVLASFDERANALGDQSARLFGSPESVEGMTAFLQKRAPSWAEPAAAH